MIGGENLPIFNYEAKAVNGQLIKGQLDAADESAVIAHLRSRNFYPINIKRQGINTDISVASLKKITIKDISIFARQFAALISSGITIMKGLEIVTKQTENPKLKAVLEDVSQDVQKGRSLSSSMKKHGEFPDLFISMVEVGEASGTLDSIMERTALYYEKQYKLQQKIKQATTYPKILVIVAILAVAFLVAKVVPTFASLIESGGGTMPLPTRILMGISSFMVNYWYILLIIIILCVFLYKSYYKTPDGRKNIDRIKITMPLFGKINKKIITSNFANTFGVLLSSGVQLMESLTICSQVVGNVIVQEALEDAREQIKKGNSLGDTLESKEIFPPMLTQMVKIGEESGTLDQVLAKTSDFYDSEVDTATAQLTSMIEPIIIVVLGGVVAFIILSILLPMFEVYNTIA